MIFFSKKSLLNTILSHYEKDQGNKEPPAFSPQLKFLKPTVYQQAEFLICPCRFPTFGFNGILPGSVFPHQVAISKHHQSPSSREALRGWGGGERTKTKPPNPRAKKPICFTETNLGKADLGSFQRRKSSGTPNLPVVSATWLLCEVAQLPSSAFPFLADLRCEGLAFSPQNQPQGQLWKWSAWTGGKLWRLLK